MSENKKKVWDSFSERETVQIAKNLAKQAKQEMYTVYQVTLELEKQYLQKVLQKGLVFKNL